MLSLSCIDLLWSNTLLNLPFSIVAYSTFSSFSSLLDIILLLLIRLFARQEVWEDNVRNDDYAIRYELLLAYYVNKNPIMCLFVFWLTQLAVLCVLFYMCGLRYSLTLMSHYFTIHGAYVHTCTNETNLGMYSTGVFCVISLFSLLFYWMLTLFLILSS